ncbi:Signal transduction histidine kinase [hydrothermal vent metagenome]|uniref:histidine kinase n=1 Tax=hydrothermal vent metagenome TaxID=652676 RepID=A0A3B0VB08_9ZZZZ
MPRGENRGNDTKKTVWERIRPSNLNIKAKIGITIGALIFYLLVFPIVKTGAPIFISVIVIAWVWGVWGGLIAGLLAMPLAIFSFTLAAIPFPNPNIASGVVVFTLLGAVIGWLSTLLEKVYQQSQDLAVARDQALEASRLKTKILSTVSHELRTPLGAILGYAELLAEGVYGSVNDKQREKLNSIVASVDELEAQVSDLMDVSRIESGHLQLFSNSFAVSGLAENVIAKTAVLAEDRSLQITCTIHPKMPQEIVGDQMRITQILTNLVTNAIKYTNEGCIQVEIYPEQTNYWGMKVTDTGIGITPEAQKYIFESFTQAHYIASYARSGIGLGLSIVHELVTLMKGTISLESKVDEGSCFTVVLPIVPSIAEALS